MAKQQRLFVKEGWSRLLDLADRLDIAHKVKQPYDQEHFAHPCGTPACALGFYTLLYKAQKRGWKLQSSGYGPLGVYYLGVLMACGSDEVMREFDLSNSPSNEGVELFYWKGCNDARNDARKAATYIRAFVWRKINE